jgi:hypothetical protein
MTVWIEVCGRRASGSGMASKEEIKGETKKENKGKVTKKICDNETCDNVDAVHKCSWCRAARYCGRECQQRAWKAHKKACLQTAKLNDPFYVHGEMPSYYVSSEYSILFWCSFVFGSVHCARKAHDQYMQLRLYTYRVVAAL